MNCCQLGIKGLEFLVSFLYSAMVSVIQLSRALKLISVILPYSALHIVEWNIKCEAVFMSLLLFAFFKSRILACSATGQAED